MMVLCFFDSHCIYYHVIKILVVIGTHPIPQKYYITHSKLNTWNSDEWREIIKPTLGNKVIRKKYDK